MADPIDEVQALSVARRSVVPLPPLDVRSTEASIDRSKEVASKDNSKEVVSNRTDLAEVKGEPQDFLGMESSQSNIEPLITNKPNPTRIGFVVERETRDVRIRVINAQSGEIIREVPPEKDDVPSSKATGHEV